MQSPDNLSLSSGAGGAGGPGYHRIRTQPEESILNGVDNNLGNGNGELGIQDGNSHTAVSVNDEDEDDADEFDIPQVGSGKGSTGDGYHQVNQDQPLPQELDKPQSSVVHNRSRNNSWDLEGGDLFEDDEEEDAQVVRRYAYRNRIPIVPAEFSHQPLPRRLWQSFVELRTAARQRRAARLLNNSQYTPTSHCILTWCCDATDRGIALVAILILVWLVVGWTTNVFTGYWLLGMILFTIRVSARTTYETIMARKRGRSSSGGGVTLRGSHITSPSQSLPSTTPSSPPRSSLEMTNDYRDHA